MGLFVEVFCFVNVKVANYVGRLIYLYFLAENLFFFFFVKEDDFCLELFGLFFL